MLLAVCLSQWWSDYCLQCRDGPSTGTRSADPVADGITELRFARARTIAPVLSA
jgi:hypothetical protein